MDSVVEDYNAKNFQLNIKGKLYAVNRGLDFNGFLDTRQALGAENLMSIIRDLDGADLDDWMIYGWFGDQRFGDDFNGQMEDGTPFFNESYFINEMKMDTLWMDIPCLRIITGRPDGRNPPKVYLSVSMAPYEREDIMEPIDFTDIIIENERGILFPGSSASIRVIDEKHNHRMDEECSIPNILTFRMPQTFCVRVRKDGRTKDSWVFMLPEDIDEMRIKLSRMIEEDRRSKYECE